MRFDLLEAFGLDPGIIAILKEKYGPELLPIQEKAFKEHHILSGGNFIIFAVTSAGKTLVGEILSLFNASKGRRVFYLVPTKALAEEKFEQFGEDYEKAGIHTVISTHDRREFDERIEEGNFHIAVVVYEKLQALLVKNPRLITEVGLIVVDELQYISEEDRGASLEILLTKILLSQNGPQLVGLSAVLGKCEKLAEWLNARMLKQEKRPVELRKGVFFDGRFSYREFNADREGEEEWFPIQAKDLFDQMVETARYLVQGKGEQTVLFVKDKPTTESVGRKLSKVIDLPPARKAIDELLNMEESVSRDLLISLLEKGIGIHNADLSWEERDIVERYVRDGEIRVLCSTTTLAVGMNLPMKNAVLDPRKWHFDKKTRSLVRTAIPVSDFENMGGRVGRFGFVEDFGRAVFVTSSYVDFKALYEKYVQGELEELVPALDSREIDKHIHNLVASGFCHSPEEIKRFLQSTFAGKSTWNSELEDEDYDRIIRETIDLSLKWGLIKKDGKETLQSTQIGKIVASKGVMLETVFHFLDFLHNADPSSITDLELLTLMALSRDAYSAYIPMKAKEKGYRGYRLELQKAVADEMEEGKSIFKGILVGSTRLAYEEERAIKKALMLRKWISPTETRDVENEYFIYSGAIKRLGEDFSWLAETLADLAREVKWEERVVKKVELLGKRLIYGVSAEGLPLSEIRLRGLGRTYINQLVRNGYDTPQAIADVPLQELERILPKRLAERLHKYCRIHHGRKEQTPSEPTPAKETWQVKPFSEIVSTNGLLGQFRSRLALAENLSNLVTDPPVILLDEKQNLFFYCGYPVRLAPTTFNLMALLAKRPGQVVTRDDTYAHLWPEFSNGGGSSTPYDRQISDHKRKIATQIRKAMEGKTGIDRDDMKNLIKTRRKVGYMLNLKNEEVFLII
ncbi:MAG: DEAD/DEAH box helicase [Desulfobacteraceae bacterium]|nr:MAG: DEAD/DEAH box helicase [Desulfobacteraceae bacterium]